MSLPRDHLLRLFGFGAAAPKAKPGDEHYPLVLILTPVKDAFRYLPPYWANLATLTYPRSRLSLGMLESDSRDRTYEYMERRRADLQSQFRRVGLWKHDFGYQFPRGMPRWTPRIQATRRAVLAKSRNHLLFHALDDEEWVLWLDVDVIQYPPDLIQRLIAYDRDIVHPHCTTPDGATFDKNAWRDHGRLHLDDLREEGELVPLDTVGGTVLLIRADRHRDGLIFPPFPYGRKNPKIRDDTPELETEGLGIMADDMGLTCWGLPNFEVIHRNG